MRTPDAERLSPSQPLSLAVRAADQLAREALRRHGASACPVPVARIAEREGAIIKPARGLAHGALTAIEGGYILKINLATSLYRRRFTIAHELGHLYLDRFRKGTLHLHDARDRLHDLLDLLAEPAFDEEDFCDAFARHLLLPEPSLAGLLDWSAVSISAFARAAHAFRVSVGTLAWRALELLPYSGGMLFFRVMGKPTNEQEMKLRLDWGTFPKSERIYLPPYDSVPDGSPLLAALQRSDEFYVASILLNFGSLRGRRSLLVKAIRRSGPVMVVVLPHEIGYNPLLPHPSLFSSDLRQLPLPLEGKA